MYGDKVLSSNFNLQSNCRLWHLILSCWAISALSGVVYDVGLTKMYRNSLLYLHRQQLL